MDFRANAWACLERAKLLLQGDDEQLRYAALELRLAMEAITYDRARVYRAEIPPTEMGTWQPKKVMSVLLELNPLADTGITFHIGNEAVRGEAAPRMEKMGTETVFGLRDIKAYYDRIGSYLHLPTLRQIDVGDDQVFSKLRLTCETLTKKLELALSSPIFNPMLGVFSTINCQRCGKPVRKRVAITQESIEVKCFDCGAEYRLTLTEEQKTSWTPIAEGSLCPTDACEEPLLLWRDEIQHGKRWQCPRCGIRYRIGRAIVRELIEPSPCD